MTTPSPSYQDIIDYFKDWDLDTEAREYIRFHCKRFEFLLNIVNKHAPHPTLVLDVGRTPLTELLRRYIVPAVDTIGFKDERFPPHSDEKHTNLDLNSGDCPQIEEHDLVVMAEVIEHLNISPEAVFRCCASWLNEGGHLVVQTPNALHFWNRAACVKGRNPFQIPRRPGDLSYHFREYTVGELKDFGIQAGLQIVGCYAENYFNYLNRPPKAKFYDVVLRLFPPSFRPGLTMVFRKTAS
jgi:SAM-dependent methyltransferase